MWIRQNVGATIWCICVPVCLRSCFPSKKIYCYNFRSFKRYSGYNMVNSIHCSSRPKPCPLINSSHAVVSMKQRRCQSYVTRRLHHDKGLTYIKGNTEVQLGYKMSSFRAGEFLGFCLQYYLISYLAIPFLLDSPRLFGTLLPLCFVCCLWRLFSWIPLP